MKKIILFLSVVAVLAACSNSEVKYDGAPLNIAVIGETPEFKNNSISVESLSLDKLSKDIARIEADFDAVLLAPDVFEGASDDKFVNVYRSSDIPIVFFDSSKKHDPFITEGLTYETAHDSLTNGSHTTIYLHDDHVNKDDAWYFYLDDKKNIDQLYTDLFKKIEEL